MLAPLSWIYGAVVSIRNACYDSGIFSVKKINTPVISVGNITTGGTGKTPLVEHLITRLTGRGLRPAVLSRGYGRTTRGTLVVSDGSSVLETAMRGGDEPVQIARKFPRCPVVVDADRVRGARLIESRFAPDVILLDDGFQHRALHRDLDVVVLDDVPDASKMRLLPAGDRREPMGALGRAGLVIVNRRREGTPTAGAPGRIVMRHRLKRIVDPATGGDVPFDTLRGAACIAFCGIGNPGAFARTLADNGISPAGFLVFPDHHRFGDRDFERIDACSDENAARFIVTTEKDAVRLDAGSRRAAGIPGGLVVAEIEAVIETGGELIDAALDGIGRAA
ncbi:MAG TPA: tetraacyldisaccharide 4'-kinase [Bacteroidota bacterium]|nr:tetraacyldisaccharide 4'-kinase [Bacteroidota bacterium]